MKEKVTYFLEASPSWFLEESTGTEATKYHLLVYAWESLWVLVPGMFLYHDSQLVL